MAAVAAFANPDRTVKTAFVGEHAGTACFMVMREWPKKKKWSTSMSKKSDGGVFRKGKKINSGTHYQT